MLESYLTIAIRHLLKQKLYSAINILGLAVGLACCILIALFVRYELSYDSDYANSERIYRVSRDFFFPDGSPRNLIAANAPVVAELLELDYPQIEAAARIQCCGQLPVSRDDFVRYETIPLADNEFFEIFDFEWLEGDSSRALADPYTIVLTESAARRYFGDESATGETLVIGNQWSVQVTGVIRDLPENTHLGFDAVASMQTGVAIFGEQFLEGWTSNTFYTYILLEEDADIQAIQDGSAEFFERHFEVGSSAYTGYTTYKLRDIHLHSNRAFELGTPGRLRTVYTLGLIALAILFVAAINFVNLATARSMQRAKEVGMRKVIGAHRARIISQFLGESVLVATLAIVLAVVLVELTLPAFKIFVQKDLTLTYFGEGSVLPLLGMLLLGVGLAAGIYPALYLSSFQPAHVLKGDLTRGASSVISRRVLVITQFAISITLMIATAVMYAQTRYAEDLALGYNKDGVVILAASFITASENNWESFKQELLAHPEIEAVSASRQTPAALNSDATGLSYEGGGPDSRSMPFMWVDYDFFEIYEIELLAGRTFSKDFGRDKIVQVDEGEPNLTAAYILNELAARQLGWTPEEAIGKWVQTSFHDTRGEVVGVVADVYFESVRSAIKPFVYMIPPDLWRGVPTLQNASIKVSGRDLEGTLAYIDAKWAEFVPDVPVVRRFLDDEFQDLYLDEQRQTQTLTFFALLAILIACLGLFGVALFTSERRTKEIGIRKVVGGSVWDVVRLLTTEFSWLVLVSNVLAWPVAYVLMVRWLDGFAYRIELSPLLFLGSAILAFLIAWLTVAGVAARSASVRPALALRHE